jgi:hypothetical protein
MNPYFRFSGHSLGVGARFHRLDEAVDLDHVIPTLGASVLAPTGGRATASAKDYAYVVDQPRKRTLLSVRKVETEAHGRDKGTQFETEVQSFVECLDVVEKLSIGLVRLHFLSTYDIQPETGVSVVTTKGSAIEGIQMGNVKAVVTLDEEPLRFTGHADQLAAFYRNQTDAYKKQHGWRFKLDEGTDCDAGRCRPHKFTLVEKIELSGPERELQDISVDGHTIYWKGFGRIVLGEVEIQCKDRSVTLVRLAMGSDAGGSGTAGSGQSNGHPSGN